MRHILPAKRLVGIDLINLAARDITSFIEVSEAQYQKRIEAAADAVLASQRHLVMLTGPSAAGKTTSANRLAAEIRKRGLRSMVVSLDDFFVGAGKYPKRPDGGEDFECVEALNLPLLRSCLRQLCETGECDAPIFDFLAAQPAKETRHIDCRGGVAVIEGLHAFNPVLTEHLPAQSVMNIYASLREEYAGADGRRLIETRDIRLARRLTRDWLFRGHDAAFTLALWPHVCQSEDLYIKAFKKRADLVLDTSFSYEPCLWKGYTENMQAGKYETEMRQLAGRFAGFALIPPERVPTDSMLREFIGQENRPPQ